MTIDNPIRLVRQLKGAPMAVLWAMTIVRQPVTEDWLIQVTGYTDKPVRTALGVLVEYGIVSRNGRYGGWMIAGPELQLPLMNYENEPELFRLDPTTTINLIEGSASENFNSSSIKGANRKYSGSKKELSAPLTVYQENKLSLLRHYGIGEPMASRLAVRNNVTVRSIIANADYLVRIGKDIVKDLGLLIHRLENNDPIPATKWEDEADGENRYDDLMNWIRPEFDNLDAARDHIRAIEDRAQVEPVNWREVLEVKI